MCVINRTSKIRTSVLVPKYHCRRTGMRLRWSHRSFNGVPNMKQHRPEVIDLVEKHFPDCIAAQSEVEWESDVQLVVYVDLYFVKLDLRHVDTPVCTAYCAELREGIKKVFHAFALPQWADSIGIRIMLSFFEAGEGAAGDQNRQNR